MNFVLSQAAVPAQSRLSWMFGALQSWSDLFALTAGVLIFVGACHLIAKRRKAAVLAAYLVLLPLPVLISLGGTISGMISSFMVLSLSPDLQVTTAEYAGATAASLLSLYTAMLVSAPTYLILAFALLARAERAGHEAVPIASPLA